MEFRKRVTITLYAKQKKRHRCTEQTFGLCGRSRGWDVSKEQHVYYLQWNRSPAQVECMRQVLRPGALGRPRGIRWRGRWEGGSGWGIHVTPWLIHVNVWQNTHTHKKIIIPGLPSLTSPFILVSPGYSLQSGVLAVTVSLLSIRSLSASLPHHTHTGGLSPQALRARPTLHYRCPSCLPSPWTCVQSLPFLPHPDLPHPGHEDSLLSDLLEPLLLTSPSFALYSAQPQGAATDTMELSCLLTK